MKTLFGFLIIIGAIGTLIGFIYLLGRIYLYREYYIYKKDFPKAEYNSFKKYLNYKYIGPTCFEAGFMLFFILSIIFLAIYYFNF
jgi:hypothetical protein